MFATFSWAYVTRELGIASTLADARCGRSETHFVCCNFCCILSFVFIFGFSFTLSLPSPHARSRYSSYGCIHFPLLLAWYVDLFTISSRISNLKYILLIQVSFHGKKKVSLEHKRRRKCWENCAKSRNERERVQQRRQTMRRKRETKKSRDVLFPVLFAFQLCHFHSHIHFIKMENLLSFERSRVQSSGFLSLSFLSADKNSIAWVHTNKWRMCETTKEITREYVTLNFPYIATCTFTRTCIHTHKRRAQLHLNEEWTAQRRDERLFKMWHIAPKWNMQVTITRCFFFCFRRKENQDRKMAHNETQRWFDQEREKIKIE